MSKSIDESLYIHKQETKPHAHYSTTHTLSHPKLYTQQAQVQFLTSCFGHVSI